MRPNDMKYVAVHGFFVNKKNQLLLLERKETGYMDGYFSVPAGHNESQERVTDAMTREIKEEIGISVQVSMKNLKHVMLRMRDDREYIDYFFLFKLWKGKIVNKEPSKCAQLKWVNASTLPKKTIQHITYAWEKIQHGEPFSQVAEKDGRLILKPRS